MSIACNEVQSAAVNTDFNAERMNKIFKYWVDKPNIRKRYTRPDGTFEKEMAENGLKSYVWDILDYPFKVEQNFTDKQLERIKIAIDGHNKDLTGKFKNIAGIFAVPRGLARLDPSSNKMLMDLESAKNYERNKMSQVEFSIQEIKDKILSAHIDVGKGGRFFGNKSYKEYRKIRDKIVKAKDENMEQDMHDAVKGFYLQDNGKLLGEYHTLVKLASKHPETIKFKNSELDLAIRNGYLHTDPVTDVQKMVKYNPKIIQAVEMSHNLLDTVGRVNIAALREMKNVIDFKYSRFNPARTNLMDKLEAAAIRIDKSMEKGNYFPKIILETMYDMKVKLENLVTESNIDTANQYMNEMMGITDKLLSQMNNLAPKNTKAASRNLNLLWESDPYVILERYSRDAIQFNKNIHIQKAYLEAMRTIPNADSAFLRGMKSFIMEEYLVANTEGRNRPKWVNDWTRTINRFQTGRTMGMNISGGIKNAASVLHYLSRVGPRAIKNAKKSYQNLKMKEIVDRVEKEEGFLFTPKDSAIMMEGIVGKDKYREGDLVFNEQKGEYFYKGTKVRDWIEKQGDKTLSFLLLFHRWTENGQRKFMFRTSFINKFQELSATNTLSESENITFAKNHALKMVNGWAYEYAPFAKNKWVRGSQNIEIVDEIGDSYIVRKGPKAAGAGLSEVAFHLMHYPMSLLETHISQLKAAGQSAKAGNWTSPEMQYVMRYAGVFGLIQLGSILFNANFNNILENETLNRLSRIERDLVEYGDEDRATFGLLSEFSGPTIGHLKYFSIMSGLTKLDSPTAKILLGNVDYTQDTEESRRYTDYQYSTEYGRWQHKIKPALRDGRSIDLVRHYLAWYPTTWIKKSRERLGFKKSSKSKYTTEEILTSLRQL
jgi:hypothetical protein